MDKKLLLISISLIFLMILSLPGFVFAEKEIELKDSSVIIGTITPGAGIPIGGIIDRVRTLQGRPIFRG